jgi:hypothetical protein
MKWTLAGGRGNTGSIFSVGTNGYYWSSSVSGTTTSNSRYLVFGGGPTLSDLGRAYGMSVRCVKD